jgi:hypothetical protein
MHKVDKRDLSFKMSGSAARIMQAEGNPAIYRPATGFDDNFPSFVQLRGFSNDNAPFG